MKPDEGDRKELSANPPVTGPSGQLWSKKIRSAEEIGRGGMATIVRGTDVMLHRELGLKVSPLLLRDSIQLAVLRRRLRNSA